MHTPETVPPAHCPQWGTVPTAVLVGETEEVLLDVVLLVVGLVVEVEVLVEEVEVLVEEVVTMVDDVVDDLVLVDSVVDGFDVVLELLLLGGALNVEPRDPTLMFE